MKLSRTKLYLRLLLSVLFVVCLALFSSISHAASSEGTSTQEPTISVPVSSWNELKGRLMKAESSINNSEKALQQANSLTATQGTALTELKIINEERTKEETGARISESIQSLDNARSEIERSLDLIRRIEERNQEQ